MKNIIKKSLIIAVLYYSTILIGCIKDQCTCDPVKNGTYNYTELRTTNLAININGDTTFASNILAADTVEQKQFGIRFELEYKIIAAALKKSAWINSAYACDCALSQFFIADSITSISLITLNKLDFNHPAGSDVTNYFLTPFYVYNPQRVSYYNILNLNQLNKAYNPNPTGNVPYDLYLRTTVPSKQMLAFELVFEFASGKKLTSKTKPVYLK
ncbi:MAG: DUF5034 domain-containing protein [Chitinophagaceae bacterium]|jgi:hypothetical protein